MGVVHDDLIALFNHSYEQRKGYIHSLTDEERSAVGKVDEWSPKDTMAHVAYWDAAYLGELSDLERTGADTNLGEVDHLNAEVWGRYADKSWAEVEAMVDSTHEALLSRLEELSEDDLASPVRHSQSDDQTLWQHLNFGYFYHPMLHIADLYHGRGDTAHANQIQEETAKRQLALDVSDRWRGAVIYNLGCHYALTGQREKALEKVKEGIDFRPDLKEWAPQDSDLASLFEDPEFRALVAG